MAARTGLTDRSVAVAALRLIDEDGLDGLSVRRLAGLLGVSPMTLYTYLPDRDALLDAVAQLLYAQIDAPSDHRLGPEDTVRRIMRSIRDLVLQHPNTVGLLAHYPPRTLDALAFVEAGYRSFRRAGISAVDTARAYRVLVAYSIGTAEVEVHRYFAQHPAVNLAAESLDTPTLNAA